MRVAADGFRVRAVQERVQRREVVLEIVDGPIRIGGSWPRQIRAGFLGGLGRERAVVWHAARHRAHDVESVERRHARAGFGHVEPRVGQIEPLACGTDRDLQQQALGASTLVLTDQDGIQRGAAIIEQERILARPLRHDALGEAGDEDDAEAAAAGLVRGADKQSPVPARGRLPIQQIERHLVRRAVGEIDVERKG